MRDIQDIYRKVHEQAFLPIFVDDELDSHELVDACVEAGFKCIEYTLRRRDAHVMIPWIKKNYPELVLLVGSTIDNENIARRIAVRHPQMMTVDELTQHGVDGFVSMLGWSERSISRYCKTHLLIPSAMTVNEAFAQVGYGAHFIKLIGPDTSLVKQCRAKPVFDFCPIMLTGGMTMQAIPTAVSYGAVIIGSGFDLMLKNYSRQVDRATVASILKEYQSLTLESRRRSFPGILNTSKTDIKTWLTSLPHYIPFEC